MRYSVYQIHFSSVHCWDTRT